MAEYIAKEDIFDEHGILLISKGKKITNAAIRRLQRHGDYKLDQLVSSRDDQSTIYAPSIRSFGERKNIPKSRSMEKASNILSDIIFESKSEPWWIYVNALGNYLDWLYTHSIDVALISMMMALELGYSDEDLKNLALGTLLHDVGKLLVPKTIWEKTEPLSDSEMACIKQHCELGMSSLEGFNFPKQYTDIVLQHHERLDGSGYPFGLKEDEICPNAKLVMVADVADAITSYRPYRQPQNMAFAISELRNDGAKYSQELVDLLERILN